MDKCRHLHPDRFIKEDFSVPRVWPKAHRSAAEVHHGLASLSKRTVPMPQTHRRHHGTQRGRRKPPVGDVEVSLRRQDRTCAEPADTVEKNGIEGPAAGGRRHHLDGAFHLLSPARGTSHPHRSGVQRLRFPTFFINKAFPGSNVCTAKDFPPIDVLLLTHDH